MIDVPLLTPVACYTVSVPILVTLVQMFKGMAPPTWWKYAPLLSVALGIIVGIGTAQAFPLQPEPWLVVGLKGIGVGLAASGLYSGSRAVGVPVPGPKAP